MIYHHTINILSGGIMGWHLSPALRGEREAKVHIAAAFVIFVMNFLGWVTS